MHEANVIREAPLAGRGPAGPAAQEG